MPRRGNAVAGAVMLIGVLAYLLRGIWPESSPVSRGAAQAASRECVQCHGLVDGVVAKEPRNRDHPGIQDTRDVEAYFETVRVARTFDERQRIRGNLLIEGERLARRYRCFQCHGQLGQGGIENRGAFKGYIPGFFGDDFSELTQDADRESIRRWILNGVDPALLQPLITGAIAIHFLERQEIRMPSFSTLSEEELSTLVDYVSTLHEMGPLDRDGVRAYLFATNALESVHAVGNGAD